MPDQVTAPKLSTSGSWTEVVLTDTTETYLMVVSETVRQRVVLQVRLESSGWNYAPFVLKAYYGNDTHPRYEFPIWSYGGFGTGPYITVILPNAGASYDLYVKALNVPTVPIDFAVRAIGCDRRARNI